MSALSETRPEEKKTAAQEIVRQYVNFIGYKIDPSWTLVDEKTKASARAEFQNVIDSFQGKVIINFYSTQGIRADLDFFFWRIAETLEPFEQMSAAMTKPVLGRYLRTSLSFLSMTKRSMYIDKHVHAGQEASRTRIIPGNCKYLFVYPFVKKREWYVLTKEERQVMMDEHIRIGHKYPSVRLNTTYSFGLDDQDFVVAFESDKPADFLDLVMELREAKSSLYTERDTPIVTGIQKTLGELLNSF